MKKKDFYVLCSFIVFHSPQTLNKNKQNRRKNGKKKPTEETKTILHERTQERNITKKTEYLIGIEKRHRETNIHRCPNLTHSQRGGNVSGEKKKAIGTRSHGMVKRRHIKNKQNKTKQKTAKWQTRERERDNVFSSLFAAVLRRGCLRCRCKQSNVGHAADNVFTAALLEHDFGHSVVLLEC